MNIDQIVAEVPDYEAFLTVDELVASARQLAREYPNRVEIFSIGKSRQGEEIEALKVGEGALSALLFAFPHSNEPMGSMTLEYLSRRLAEDEALSEGVDFTWYLVKCIDPDGARLNEGWFKGPFTLEHYAHHYYRPPGFQQIEWTFPIDYKTLHFHAPLPETQALMALIDQVRPHFLYSLHNSDFGGGYFYVSKDCPSLYEPLHTLVKGQGLPLHLGEPETPFMTELAQAIYIVPRATHIYDYNEEHSTIDPAEVMRHGTSSFDYASRYGNPLSLVCEVPYFYHPSIEDTSPTDTVRREALLEALERERGYHAFLLSQYEAIKGCLAVGSPFRESVEHYLEIAPQRLAAREDWARSDPRAQRVATVAERFDSLVINKSNPMFMMGMFLRMIDAQVAAAGEEVALTQGRERVNGELEALSQELASELEYSVIPIQKLVRVQVGSALLAADYAKERQ